MHNIKVWMDSGQKGNFKFWCIIEIDGDLIIEQILFNFFLSYPSWYDPNIYYGDNGVGAKEKILKHSYLHIIKIVVSLWIMYRIMGRSLDIYIAKIKLMYLRHYVFLSR